MASSIPIPINRVVVKSTQFTKAGKSLFLNENYADVLFKFNCDDKCETIPAHKNILATSSQVFEAMLDGRWKEQNVVEIEDASAEAFKEFLQFFYLDEVEITIENIFEVVYLGKKYLLDECVAECEQILIRQKTLDVVLIGLEVAISFDLFELKNHCLQLISADTTALFALDTFFRCSKNVLKCILENAIDCEEKLVFDACMNWAEHASQKSKTDASVMEHLKHELGDCLHLIQFGSMSPQQISECVINYKGLFNRDELEELYSIHSPNHSLKIFKNIERTQKWTECWLVGHRSAYYYFAGIERRVTIIKVNKTMRFGAISTAYLYNILGHDRNTDLVNIVISEIGFGLTQGEQRILLRQPACFKVGKDFLNFHNSKINYTEFKKVVLVKPNYVYEIQIEFDKSDITTIRYSSKYLLPEICFGKDYKVTVDVKKSQNCLTCFYFK